MTTTRVVLLGGPYSGRRADLTKLPDQLKVGGPEPLAPVEWYEAVKDPDTDEHLGGYVWMDPDKPYVWDRNGIALGVLLPTKTSSE